MEIIEPAVTDEEPQINQTPQFTDLVRATQFGRLEEVKEYLESNLFDVNQRDSEDVTLLHWAAINNKTKIVEYLLNKGANVDAIGGDLKSTPLQWAVRQGHLSVVVLLIKRGADSNILDFEGCNALHLAAQFGHTALVAYLVAKGMDIDFPGTNGLTALMWSCYKVTQVDPTRLLLTLGASHKQTDYREKNTALHWAVFAKNLTATTLLLEAGADVDTINSRGDSPLTIARKNQSPLFIQMLEDKSKEKVHHYDLRQRIMKNKYLCDITRILTPFIAYFLIAFILDSGASPLFKILSLITLIILLFLFGQVVHESCWTTNFPVAVYLTITFWLYLTLALFCKERKSQHPTRL